MTDKRRYGVIAVRFQPGPPTLYTLSIAGQHWAAVEGSPSRRTWCIEDAAGRCLLPTPEEAERQLREQQAIQGPQDAHPADDLSIILRR